MLNTENENREKDVEMPSLEKRRLEGITNGAFDWIGKGFLEVIRNDCDTSKHPKHQKK